MYLYHGAAVHYINLGGKFSIPILNLGCILVTTSTCTKFIVNGGILNLDLNFKSKGVCVLLVLVLLELVTRVVNLHNKAAARKSPFQPTVVKVY
jgi:hypothetical protein